MKQKETEAAEKEKFEPYYAVEVTGVQKDEDDDETTDEGSEENHTYNEGTYDGDDEVEKEFKEGSLFERKANAYKFILHILQNYEEEDDFSGIYCYLITGNGKFDFIEVYNYEAGYTRWEESGFEGIAEECEYLDKYFQSLKA